MDKANFGKNEQKKMKFRNVEIPTFQFLIKFQNYASIFNKGKSCIILAKNTRRLSHLGKKECKYTFYR